MSLDFSRPMVYLITPGECDPANFAASSASLIGTIAAAVEAGVDLIQIREKRLTGKLLFELAQRATDVVRGGAAKLLVNDRFDIAVAAGAGGVHLTSTSMSPKVVRGSVGPDFIIGVSIHVGDDPPRLDGADFALLGPVFGTPRKGEGIGVGELASFCGSSPNPVIGVGGIDEQNYRDVLDAGAAGFAAIRALNEPTSMRRIMHGLKR